MTALLTNRWGQPGFGLGTGFASHPAALDGDAVPAPAFVPPPRLRVTEAAAPPWVSPYRQQAWALPRAERRMLLAPPAMPFFPERDVDPAPEPPLPELAPLPAAAELPPPIDTARPPDPAPSYPGLPPARERWAPPKPAKPFLDFTAPQPPPTTATPTARRRWIGGAAIGATLAIVLVAGAVVLPRLWGPHPVTAVFTAPRLVLSANTDGFVSAVSVRPGETVQPDTALLTMRPASSSSAALHSLLTQIGSLRARAGLIDSAMAQPLPDANDARLRQSEEQHLRQSTSVELDQLQRLATAATPPQPPETAIQAGVRGTVLSMDAQPGTSVPTGTPLVQLLDCGRAFLAVRSGAGSLHAGQTVRVSFPHMVPFIGTIRASSGRQEPANALVVAPTGLPADACPVGQVATITTVEGTPVASAR